MKNIEIKRTPRGHEYPVGYEFFYEDENGILQDSYVHEEILADGDEEGARQISIQVAERNGLGDVARHLLKWPPDEI